MVMENEDGQSQREGASFGLPLQQFPTDPSFNVFLKNMRLGCA